MEIIIETLRRPGNVQNNGINGEAAPSGHVKASRNALAIISRIPLEPISVSLRDSVYKELISLDRALIYGLIPQLTGNEATIDALTITRRAIVHLIDAVSKDVITVLRQPTRSN